MIAQELLVYDPTPFPCHGVLYLFRILLSGLLPVVIIASGRSEHLHLSAIDPPDNPNKNTRLRYGGIAKLPLNQS